MNIRNNGQDFVLRRFWWFHYPHCQIPQELAKTTWITTATHHTWEFRATGPPQMNFDWLAGFNMEVVFVVFLFFRKKSLSTRNTMTLILPRRFRCQDRMSAHAGVGSSQHISVKYYFSWGGPFRCKQVSSGDQYVEFSFVNNSGLCASHLVNLLSWWLLRHGTLIVHLKITG